MSKILELNSYSLYDELGNRDYMVYEVKYDDGHKEYVSRDVFRNLKALEIIKDKRVDIGRLYAITETYPKKYQLECYNDEFFIPKRYFLTQQEYELLKEVLL